MNETLLLIFLLLVIAFLYSSVGHGGASGYLAVLGVMGYSAAIMKPSALLLNIFVAGISFIHFYRGGHFRWRLFFPFALTSVPFSYLGTFVELDPLWYRRILGVCLIVASLRIVNVFKWKVAEEKRELNIYAGLLIGAALGFLSGMIGIGGGIILSPLILIFGWGNLKETAAVSALFIVVNSIAGLAGIGIQRIGVSAEIYLWLLAALIGGFAGAYWGSREKKNFVLKNLLAGILFVSAVKLIFI